MTTPIPSPRRPWLAALLSFLCTGLGHVYAGRVTRGLVLFFLSILALPLIGLWGALPPSQPALLAIALTLALVLLLYLVAILDAWRVARRGRTAYVLREYNHAGLYVLMALVGLVWPALGTSFLREHVFEAFRVPAGSMQPTIQPGDRILVRKAAFDPATVARGNVVVFLAPEEPHRPYVKRVIGLGGDTVALHDGAVWVNGKRAERTPAAGPGDQQTETLDGRSYRVHWSADDAAGTHVEAVAVPEGHVFVLGDNRGNSRDSRQFGTVPATSLLGVAVYVWLPLDRFGLLH